MKKFVLITSLLSGLMYLSPIFAQSDTNLAAPITIGPTLSNGSVTACIKNKNSFTCNSYTLPKDIGIIDRIAKTLPVKNSTVSWYAFGETSAAFCAINIPQDKLVCSHIDQLNDALSIAPYTRQQSMALVISSNVPNIRLAVNNVIRKLDLKTETGKGRLTPLEVDASGTPPGPAPGTDYGGGGTDIPIVIVPGTPEPTAPSDGGLEAPDAPVSGNDSGLGTGPSVTPPGAGPTESKERALCTSSAYLAWLAEDVVCKRQRTPELMRACNDYNWREYTISLEMCRDIP